MNRRDWNWWRFHVIYREALEEGWGVMYYPGAEYTPTYSPTLDVWVGGRFWTVRWERRYA